MLRRIRAKVSGFHLPGRSNRAGRSTTVARRAASPAEGRTSNS
jgi:hypothetical protein